MNNLERTILWLIISSCLSVTSFTVGKYYSPISCTSGIDFCFCERENDRKDVKCTNEILIPEKKRKKHAIP